MKAIIVKNGIDIAIEEIEKAKIKTISPANIKMYNDEKIWSRT
jgi:hypothetical protein